jgi:hypothetical protein
LQAYWSKPSQQSREVLVDIYGNRYGWSGAQAGLDYTGRAFPGYSTRRMSVSPNHMPRPKGGRRVPLPSLKGTHTAHRIVMADMTRSRMSRPRGTKTTEEKKGTKLKTVAHAHGCLQYGCAWGEEPG